MDEKGDDAAVVSAADDDDCNDDAAGVAYSRERAGNGRDDENGMIDDGAGRGRRVEDCATFWSGRRRRSRGCLFARRTTDRSTELGTRINRRRRWVTRRDNGDRRRRRKRDTPRRRSSGGRWGKRVRRRKGRERRRGKSGGGKWRSDERRNPCLRWIATGSESFDASFPRRSWRRGGENCEKPPPPRMRTRMEGESGGDGEA